MQQYFTAQVTFVTQTFQNRMCSAVRFSLRFFQEENVDFVLTKNDKLLLFFNNK